MLANNSTDILIALRQIAIRVDHESFESHTSTWPLLDFIYLPALFIPYMYAREQIYSKKNQYESEPEVITHTSAIKKIFIDECLNLFTL